MINFRYHLVSLVAVFLALAIGIVAGSTVIKESILDQTQQNLDQAEKNLKQLEDTNAALRAELDQLKNRDDALERSGAADLLQGRLTGTPVLMVKVDGVDDTATAALRHAITTAGATVVGTVTVTDKLALTTPAEIAALGNILGSRALDPTVLLSSLASRLATLVTGAAENPPALPVEVADHSDGITSTTTTAALSSRSMVASNLLRSFLDDLESDGFVKIADQPEGADSLDLGGVRLTVISGAGAKVDNSAFVYPFLQQLVTDGETSALAVEATKAGSEVPRGSFVGPIRDDSKLHDHVSTVDDVEWFVGQAASVMALRDLGRGTVGHYGVGDGASALLPATPAPSSP